MKLSLSIGINNYPNPRNNLSGCVNDASDMADLLFNQYGFEKNYMLYNEEATVKNVKNTIFEILSQEPEILVITNSSHGTRIPNIEGGYQEAICMYDGNIVDYDLKNLINSFNSTTKVIFFSDSCHSAGVTREFLDTMNDYSYYSKAKYLPSEDNIEAFQASSEPTTRAIFDVQDDKNILMAGCKSDQYSYDASFNGRPNGAFTYYVSWFLKDNPNQTYRQLVDNINKYLPCRKYPQCPVIECREENKDDIVFS